MRELTRTHIRTPSSPNACSIKSHDLERQAPRRAQRDGRRRRAQQCQLQLALLKLLNADHATLRLHRDSSCARIRAVALQWHAPHLNPFDVAAGELVNDRVDLAVLVRRGLRIDTGCMYYARCIERCMSAGYLARFV